MPAVPARAPASSAAAMPAELRPLARRTLSARLGDELRRLILRGTFKAGDHLPNERALAERFRANRHTVREALRALESEGLVRVRHGEGAVVEDFRERGRLEILPAVLREGGAAPDEALRILRDLLALRRVVGEEAAAQTAARAGRAEAAELLQRVAELRAAARADTMRLDLELFARLVQLSGSLVLRWTLNTFLPVYRELIDAFPGLWLLPPGYPRGLQAVAAAVARRSPEAARRAMRRHFEKCDAVVIKALGGRR